MAGLFRGLVSRLQRRRIVVERSPIDDFADVAFPVVLAPFYGSPVPVKLRRLTQAQIRSCGDFSLIKTFEDKVAAMDRPPTMRELNAYADRYHRLVEAAMVAPTYEELVGMFDGDQRVEQARAKLEELRRTVQDTPLGPKRAALEEEIESTRVWCDLILPMDFLSFVMSYTMNLDDSDIDKVTEDALLDAAILAYRGRNNPADHLDGRFTPFMKDDINRRAWVLFERWREKNKKKEPTHGR